MIVNKFKLCSKCLRKFPATNENFYVAKGNRDGLHGKCKSCWSKSNKEYFERNPEVYERNKQKATNSYWKDPETHKEKGRERNRLLRLDALNAYSNRDPKCACCAEAALDFLVIDHIDGGGNNHRREIGCGSGSHTYLWLKKNNYPAGFRVLCHNCNMALGLYGKCPHEKFREGISDYEI